MERIREALERARKDRGTGGFADLGAPRTGDRAKPGEIAYTTTRTVKVMPNVLRENRIVDAVSPGVFVDAYKILCTQVLQKLREKSWNAVAVTSPGEHEGKTLTAINLAISLAKEVDQTVLLVDADLRHPSIHSYFGLQSGKGLRDYLIADTPLDQMLIHPGIGRLVVLPGGEPLLASSELLGSSKMAELVQELKSRYPSRIVVFDLPPVLSAADALAFAPYVDAALLVIEEGKTQKEDMSRALEMLSATTLLGTVLNKSSEVAMPVADSGSWWSRLLRRGGR